jgi:large subunit ribosomal protein L25
MAEQTLLEVAPRTVVGKANKRLRKDGLIPGNIFGGLTICVAMERCAVY